MTKEYIGIKQITAWEEEKDGEPGYGVKYADGYQSWSPAGVFEEAYHHVHAESEKSTRHPAIVEIMQFFRFEHLPPHLQKVSRPFCLLAEIIATGPGGAEKTVALRKLLESKDAAVRAAV